MKTSNVDQYCRIIITIIVIIFPRKKKFEMAQISSEYLQKNHRFITVVEEPDQTVVLLTGIGIKPTLITFIPLLRTAS
jgi:hypothetical protein